MAKLGEMTAAERGLETRSTAITMQAPLRSK